MAARTLGLPKGERKAGWHPAALTRPNVTASLPGSSGDFKTFSLAFAMLIQAASGTPWWGGSTAIVISRNRSLFSR